MSTGARPELVRRIPQVHIDIIHQPRPEEPTEGRRLEGRPRARLCQRPSFVLREPQDAVLRTAPQDEVRGVQFYSPDLISFMESVHEVPRGGSFSMPPGSTRANAFATVMPLILRSGAISASGASTKARSNRCGCGKVRPDSSISRASNAMISMSRMRGPQRR